MVLGALKSHSCVVVFAKISLQNFVLSSSHSQFSTVSPTMTCRHAQVHTYSVIHTCVQYTHNVYGGSF